jgi:predicted nucleotidyltransferase component of viral defense system
MIDRREIIDAATRFGLNPHVIEKDLVLGWVLAGINAHEALAESWIFKGGTCLKKCYFETYRFSEDLDFTLTDATHIDQEFLKGVFAEIGDWIYEQTGIELPADRQDFDIFKNPRGNLSCQGKLSYRGPISPSAGGLPRIKLDLTADEKVVLPPVRVPVFHPYSDAPEDGIHVLAYAYEEAFGEKIRALAERTRPRDLYDVVNLFRNEHARCSPSALLDVLQQKCAFKGINVPRLADLEEHRTDLEGGWATMLAHQLPALPPLDAFWNELPAFFVWLEGGAVPVVPAAYAIATGETVLRDRTMRLPLSGGALSFLEVIRFAASNRLCVELDYQGSTRRIEPYSLRRTSDGNIVLHAFNADKGEHRSYRVDRIAGARTTNQTFVPRYEIELTPEGPVHIKPASARSSGSFGGFSVSPSRSPRSSRRSSGSNGPTYVYECSYCGKRFNRKKLDSQLNPHKDKHGYPCAGRHGMYVDTR